MHSAVLLKITEFDSSTGDGTGTLWVWAPQDGQHVLRSTRQVTISEHEHGRPRNWKAKIEDPSISNPAMRIVGYLTAARNNRQDREYFILRVKRRLWLTSDKEEEPSSPCDEPPDDDILEEEDPPTSTDYPESPLDPDDDPLP